MMPACRKKGDAASQQVAQTQAPLPGGQGAVPDSLVDGALPEAAPLPAVDTPPPAAAAQNQAPLPPVTHNQPLVPVKDQANTKLIPTGGGQRATTRRSGASARTKTPSTDQVMEATGWVGETWAGILQAEPNSKTADAAVAKFKKHPAVFKCARNLLYVHRALVRNQKDEALRYYNVFKSIQAECPLEAGQLLSVSKQTDMAFRNFVDPPKAKPKPKPAGKRKGRWDLRWAESTPQIKTNAIE